MTLGNCSASDSIQFNSIQDRGDENLSSFRPIEVELIALWVRIFYINLPKYET
jgi:hypothetical protein